MIRNTERRSIICVICGPTDCYAAWTNASTCPTCYGLQYRYKLSKELLAKMVQARGGKCDICHQVPRKRLLVDHCHTTGVVRGLLCHTCNSGLGCFRDSPEMMGVAIEYLQRTCGKIGAPPADEGAPNLTHVSAH